MIYDMYVCITFKKVKQFIIFLPLKMGHRSQTVIPPSLIYCPIPTSRKKIGMPPVTRQMK
jgi:hypothetical protein